MRVWRLTRQVHATLDGEGARRHGGRWTSPGHPAVYLADSAALALLEVLVHLDLTPDLLPDDTVMMEIDVPDALAVERIAPDAFAPDLDFRVLGDAWLARGRTPLLVVPSVIVPQQRNLILNPRHAEAARVEIAAIAPFRLDGRLL